MKRVNWSVVGVLVALVLPVIAWAWVPVGEISSNRLWVVEGADSIAMSYASSRDLSEMQLDVTRLVVDIPGSNRESEVAFGKVMTAHDHHDRNVLGHTLVLSPQFLFRDDLDEHQPTDPLFWWRNIQGIGPQWNYGYESRVNTDPYPLPFGRSSFALLDSLISMALTQCPNVRSVSMSGLSAGAKTVQHYAMTSEIQHRPDSPPFMFLLVAPAHYGYIGPERRVGDSLDEFAIPLIDTLNCLEYNEWPFGFDVPNPYFEDRDAAVMKAEFLQQELRLVIGDEDTLQLQGDNQLSCQAMIQGEHDRMQRGMIWFNHLVFSNGGVQPDKQSFHVEPGFGHQMAIYYQEHMRYYLFDHYDMVDQLDNYGFVVSLSVPDPSPQDHSGFDFEYEIGYGHSDWRTADVWVSLVHDDEGTELDDYLGDHIFEPDVAFMAGDQFLEVPDWYPSGEATMTMNVGVYPDLVLASMDVAVIVDPTNVTPIELAKRPIPRISFLGPNPFNSTAKLQFETPVSSTIKVSVFDVLGREALVAADQEFAAGAHTLTLSMGNLPSGLYFVNVRSETNFNETRKLMLLR